MKRPKPTGVVTIAPLLVVSLTKELFALGIRPVEKAAEVAGNIVFEAVKQSELTARRLEDYFKTAFSVPDGVPEGFTGVTPSIAPAKPAEEGEGDKGLEIG